MWRERRSRPFHARRFYQKYTKERTHCLGFTSMFAQPLTFEFGASKKHNPSPNSIRNSKKALPLAELNQRQHEARKTPFHPFTKLHRRQQEAQPLTEFLAYVYSMICFRSTKAEFFLMRGYEHLSTRCSFLTANLNQTEKQIHNLIHAGNTP